jgi:plastocyanin
MRCSKFAPWLVSWFVLLAFPASATNYNVAVGPDGDLIFSPRNLTINVGDSVTWQSAGGGLHAHNVVANNGSFRCAAGCDGEGGSGTPSAAPWTVTRTFNTPGTVDYNCEVHKSGGMTGSIIVNGASAAALAVEFYHSTLNHYFLTYIPNEIGILDAGVTIKGWVRTGQSFNVYSAAGSGTSPVCRFYIPPAKGDSHFYGRGTVECNATGQNNPSFINEDPQFFHVALPTLGVCPAGLRNVYRVFSNRLDANHRYMVDPAIRDHMVAIGWLAEGDGPDLVVMCAPL